MIEMLQELTSWMVAIACVLVCVMRKVLLDTIREKKRQLAAQILITHLKTNESRPN